MATAVHEPVVYVRHRKIDPDYVVRWLAVIAAAVSVAVFVHFLTQGVTLAYKDAISHLDIARRVLDSPTRGLAQLGGVWLPLPHLLAVPLIGIDVLYYSGFAGSVFSMMAYVVTTVLLYKTVYSLTGRKLAGVIGALVFMANPNVLYMQSTPMTELLLFVCMAGMVYGVQQWVITDENKYLIGAGIAGLLGTLTRYEAWVLFGAMAVLVAVVAVRKRYPYVRTEGTLLAFLFFGGVGVALWAVWNLLLFGNPLYFQVGEYAKPSLWVGEGEAAVGDWWIAFLTYSYAILDNLWPLIVILMIAGLVAMAVRERFALKTLPTFTLLVLFPFFVVALEQGQRPLHVAQITGDLYNVRFGLLMVLPAAIAIGYLASLSPRHRRLEQGLVSVLVVAAAAFASWGMLDKNNIASLREPTVAMQKTYTETTQEVSEYLALHGGDGKILMESFGNDMIMFNARIPLSQNIHEGSFRLWEPALQDPAGQEIEWIVMRHAGNNQSDIVYRALYNKPALQSYRLVFENSSYYIYERRVP